MMGANSASGQNRLMLTIDAIQRYSAVAAFIQATLPPKSSILDVGGGTGHLQEYLPNHRCIVADLRQPPKDSGVIATGAHLPFEDDCFDVSLSLDTLEHIPPPARLPFLSELSRVAKRTVLLTAPFDTPGVDSAERIADSNYELHYGKPHPWLHEHLCHERPKLAETLEAFAPFPVEVQAIGNLSLWLRLQLLDIELDSMPDGLRLAGEIDQLYREHLCGKDYLLPCYRQLLAVRLDDSSESSFENCMGEPNETDMSDALHHFELGLHTLLGAHRNNGTALSPDMRLLENYRLAISDWEKAYTNALKLAEEGHKWHAELYSRRSIQILRWCLKLLGRDL